MKYLINKTNYCNFEIIKDNALKPRSYFIPFKNKEEESKINLLNKRYSSELVECLNGDWDYKYLNNPNDLKDIVDTDDIAFEKIDVPSCIQYRGFENPCYLNIRYPFNYNPPKIPTNKPVNYYFSLFDFIKKANKDEYNHISLYRRFFKIVDLDYNYIISFLGVCSCLDLYVNGNYVGYFEESHNTSEFDITKYLIKGNNELFCVVHKWCNGTYLECQDMFRNTGIFRDVLLRKETKNSIFDIDINTYKHEDKYDLKVEVIANTKLKVTLKGHGLEITKEGLNSFEFKDLLVKEWNSEEPNLYDLYLESEAEFIHERIGFKDIKIINDTYYLNDKPIKLHGINHHDTSALNGYYETANEIDADLKILKEYNVDTIRTSHYAPDPLLMELAQEYGFYVVSEVDLECHGVITGRLPYSYNWLSDDAKWIKHYVSRVINHYNRDKLYKTAIVMYSLGNESGAGICTDKMYEYFKTVTKIPVQYESAIYNKKIIAYDIASNMYPEVSKVESIGNKSYEDPKFLDRPYFMCEYAHAMGVGPGNIEEYWDLVYKYPSLMGGCIWEMKDHTVLEKDGSYSYGGDHNEWIHDANFCADGVFYPDLTPSTGAYIMKHAYRPLRFKLNGNILEIYNTKAFLKTDYCLVIDINGHKKEYKLAIEPLSNQTIELDIDIKKENYITIYTYEGDQERDVSQFVLNQNIQTIPTSFNELPSWFKVLDKKATFIINNKEIKANEEHNLLYRAAMDNDKENFFVTTMPKWYKQKEVIKDVNVSKDVVRIITNIKVGLNSFKVTDIYRGYEDNVYLESTIEPLFKRGYIPRFGKCFKADETFDYVSWFGKEKESYLDMQEHTITKLNKTTVIEMTEPNIKPQESGNRINTLWVEVDDKKEGIRFEAIEKPFELAIKPYSDRELIKMKHRKDEIRTGTYITINAFEQGVGTGSCGPATLKKHRYKADKYTLRMVIKKI